MSLDLFESDQRDATAHASANLAPALPSTFGQAFDVSWRHGALFGQSVAGFNARREALDDYTEMVRKQTGVSVGVASVDAAPDFSQIQAEVQAIKDKDPTLQFDVITEEELDRLAIEKSAAARKAYRQLSTRERTTGGTAGMILGTAASGVTDPINVLTFPLAAPTGLGILATAGIWGGIAGGTQIAIEAAGAGYREQVQPGYGASGEPLTNIAEAGAFGGALGGSFKAAANVWRRVQTGQWPRHVRDAGNVVSSEANIIETNIYPGVHGEVMHRTALQKSIDDLVTGNPVDVDNILTPSVLQAYEQRLYTILNPRAAAERAETAAAALEREAARLPTERLAEQQLLELRGETTRIEAETAAARAGLERETAAVTAGRTAQEERAAALSKARSEVEALDRDITATRERLGEARPPTDPITEGRLAAIEQDLKAAGVTAEQRAALQAERALISETLAKTAPGDARLIGSLQAEEKALTRALAKKQKALERAEAALAKAEQKIADTEAGLPRRAAAIEQRATSRAEVLTTEIRRSVSRLAQEYGIRMGREEAEAWAARIMAADDPGVVTRELTEALVSQKIATQKVAPELPLGEPSPIAQKRAEAEYNINEMRKAIRATAREVGYDMSQAESARIANAVAKAPDEQAALAILDELMLRPRTLADMLPGDTLGDILRPALPGTEAARPEVPRIRAEAAPPTVPAQPPTVIKGADYKQADGTIDGKAVNADINAKVEQALDEGASVTYYVEGKPVEIVAINRGMLQDAKGQRWGTLPLLAPTPGKRTEIEIVPKQPLSQGPHRAPAYARPTMAEALTPKAIEKTIADANGEMAETVARDFDRVRAEKGNIEIPFGLAEDGTPMMRKIEDVVAEAEAAEKAAKELMDCIGPQPKEAA